jgi:hypothetical protein
MSPDSLDQYTQAVSNKYHDWHPPIMAGLWSLLNIYFKGPQGLLFFHLGLLWGASYLLYSRFVEKSFAWIFLTIGILPFVVNFSGVLWKDVGLAFSLLFAFALILKFNGIERRPLLVPVLVAALLFYGMAVRINSIIAVLPIVFLAIRTFLPNINKIKTLALGAAFMLITVWGISAFNYTVLKADKTNPEIYVMFDDLQGLSAINKTSFFPPEAGIGNDLVNKCKNAIPGTAFCYIEHGWDKWEKRNDFYREVRSAWMAQVSNNPVDYAENRFKMFSRLLRSPSMSTSYVLFPAIVPNSFNIKQDRTVLTNVFIYYVLSSAETAPFLFKPYFWLALDISLLLFYCFFSDFRRATFPAFLLVVSSTLYILSYIPVTAAADIRYIYWSIVSTTVAVMLIVLNFIIPSFAKKPNETI